MLWLSTIQDCNQAAVHDVGSFRAGGHIHSFLFRKDCWEGDQIVMEGFYYSEMITNGQDQL